MADLLPASMPETVTPPDFELVVSQWLRTVRSWREPLNVDLRKTSFVETPALVLALAVLNARARANIPTTLRLPASQSAWDWMRILGFPQAVEKCLGATFSTLLSLDDQSRLSEPIVSFPNARVSLSPYETAVGHLWRNRFFGFLVYKVTTKADTQTMVKSEWHRWSQGPIMNLLDRHLMGSGADVGRIVIRESLRNVADHPRARHAVVASQIYTARSGTSGAISDRALAISILDDGRGIVETLREPLAEGLSVRSEEPSSVERFLLHSTVADQARQRAVYESQWTPSLGSHDEEVLLASILPGISRHASREPSPPQDDEPLEPSANVGYGLYSLCQSVVNAFDGSVAVRTGDLFMNVRAPTASERKTHDVDYRAKIDRRSPDSMPFAGNMITIRLPLRRGREK